MLLVSSSPSPVIFFGDFSVSPTPFYLLLCSDLFSFFLIPFSSNVDVITPQHSTLINLVVASPIYADMHKLNGEKWP